MAVYLVVDAALIGTAVALPVRASFLLLALTALGAGAFWVGVWRNRPEPGLAWWLLVAGAVAFPVAVLPGVIVYAAVGHQVGWTAFLLVLPAVPFMVGLALLARLGSRLDAAVTIDALLVSMAAYLVLFAAVIRPTVGTGWPALVSVVAPLAAFVVLAMIVRVIFAGAVRSWSVGLTLLALGARAAGAVALVVPAIASTGFQGVYDENGGIPAFAHRFNPLESPMLVLWVVYGVLIGAAGLHPSLARTRGRRESERATTPTRRMVLVAVSCTSVIIGWLFVVGQATRDLYSNTGFTIPVVISAGVLVLLVVRLALVARLARGEREMMQQELDHRATHDQLTGLSNRTALAARMESVMTGSPASHTVALIDLDFFKDVNDTHGHAVGDELLIEVSHRLTDAIPQGVTAARLGGDEFAVLLEDRPEAAGVAWAKQVLQSLRRPYHIADNEFFLSASIGVGTSQSDGEHLSPSQILRNADLALYAAKAAGKDRVAVFRRELESAQLNRTRLSMGLKRAITNRELSVDYQPICDLSSFRIVAAEALLRWTPRGKVAVPPSDFIPVAEDTGLIKPIGRWVLRQSCRDVRSWYAGHGVAVTVNVSARQLDDADFADMVLAVLREFDLPGRALVIEITETSLMTTSTRSIAQLRRLRAHGVRVAIDDFGTGYSSLASVVRLPVDIIKIDKSFVQDAGHAEGERSKWALVRAVIQMAEPLNLQTVAEGVETVKQADKLRELRCQLGQGFLIGRPTTADELQRSLSRSDIANPHQHGEQA